MNTATTNSPLATRPRTLSRHAGPAPAPSTDNPTDIFVKGPGGSGYPFVDPRGPGGSGYPTPNDDGDLYNGKGPGGTGYPVSADDIPDTRGPGGTGYPLHGHGECPDDGDFFAKGPGGGGYFAGLPCQPGDLDVIC